MKKILLFPALLVSLSSCYYDNEEDLYGTTACETTNLTYAANVEKIMIQSCAVTGCHKVGSGLIPLETYTQVKTYVDNGILFDRVITKKNMPPSGGLSDCDASIIDEWIKQGAKQ